MGKAVSGWAGLAAGAGLAALAWGIVALEVFERTGSSAEAAFGYGLPFLLAVPVLAALSGIGRGRRAIGALLGIAVAAAAALCGPAVGFYAVYGGVVGLGLLAASLVEPDAVSLAQIAGFFALLGFCGLGLAFFGFNGWALAQAGRLVWARGEEKS